MLYCDQAANVEVHLEILPLAVTDVAGRPGKAAGGTNTSIQIHAQRSARLFNQSVTGALQGQTLYAIINNPNLVSTHLYKQRTQSPIFILRESRIQKFYIV